MEFLNRCKISTNLFFFFFIQTNTHMFLYIEKWSVWNSNKFQVWLHHKMERHRDVAILQVVSQTGISVQSQRKRQDPPQPRLMMTMRCKRLRSARNQTVTLPIQSNVINTMCAGTEIIFIFLTLILLNHINLLQWHCSCQTGSLANRLTFFVSHFYILCNWICCTKMINLINTYWLLFPFGNHSIRNGFSFCSDGVMSEEKLCPDGMVFNDYDPDVEKCDLPYNIDCSKRSKLRKSFENKLLFGDKPI